MFTAINQKQQLISLLEEIPKKGETYRCPSCHCPVRLKVGKVLRAHFAHLQVKNCHFTTENESKQHLEAKALLYQWAKKEGSVEVEAYLPALGQIADLLVDQHLALEIQCSTLSMTRLQERTRAYQEKGYSVLWLLGKDLWVTNRLSSLQRQFLRFSQNMGFYLWEIDLEKQCLRLRYLIHEDLKGHSHSLTREFPFGRGSLTTILRTPYLSQTLQSFTVQQDPNFLTYVRRQLYYKNPKWLRLQAEAYQQGENLLTWSLESFYPQIRLPESSLGFAQVTQDLGFLYKAFENFYQKQKKKQVQVVYSPIFYVNGVWNQLEEA